MSFAVLPQIIAKKKKLEGFLNSVFEDSLYKDELRLLLEKFDLTKEQVLASFFDYNIDVHDHDNSIYNSQAIRVVLHVHNLVKGSWHLQRQSFVCELLEKISITKAIDLGFGVPSRYVRKLLVEPRFHLTLCDYQQAALNFAKELIKSWDHNYDKKIDFLCEDMEKFAPHNFAYDLYISLLSIEHVKNPTNCLARFVNMSFPHSHFLIEIPIGPITPEHTIAWNTKDEAREWINSVGLEVLHERFTKVNPLVDLFAEAHGFNYGGLLMLCKKK